MKFCISLQDGTEIQAFVAESQSSIVGIAIVRREEVQTEQKQKLQSFYFIILASLANIVDLQLLE